MTQDELLKEAKKYAATIGDAALKNLVIAAYMDGARAQAAHLHNASSDTPWHEAGIVMYEEIRKLLDPDYRSRNISHTERLEPSDTEIKISYEADI